MALIKVVTENDIGKGLAIENTKLVAKGIKQIAVQGNDIVVTKYDDSTENVALPAQTVDVKLTGAELVDETKLKLTLSDNSELRVDLAKFLNIDTDTKPTAVSLTGTTLQIDLSDSTNVQTDIATALQNYIDANVKGDEVQSLGGVKLGYFIKA